MTESFFQAPFLVCFRNITGNQKQTDKISHVTLDFQTRFHCVSYMLGSLVLESMTSEEGKPKSQLLGTDWEKASYTLPAWCWTSFCAQETTSSSKDKVISWWAIAHGCSCELVGTECEFWATSHIYWVRSLREGLLVKLCFHSPQLTLNHLRSLNIELTEIINTKDLPPAEPLCVSAIHLNLGTNSGHQKYYSTWVQWHTPTMPALWELKQKDDEVLTNLGYMASSKLTWATWGPSLKQQQQ